MVKDQRKRQVDKGGAPLSSFGARTTIGFIFNLRYKSIVQAMPIGLKQVLTCMMVSAGSYVDQLFGNLWSTNEKARNACLWVERVLIQQHLLSRQKGLTGFNKQVAAKIRNHSLQKAHLAFCNMEKV